MALISTQEAATRIGVSLRTVQRWCAAGLLPSTWQGRDRMIEEEILSTFQPRPKGRPRVSNPVRRRSYHDQ